MLRRSLTFRLTLFFSLVATAVLLVIGYLVGAAVENHFVDEDRMELDARTAAVRSVLTDSASSGPDLAARIEGVLIGQHDVFVGIATRGGDVRYASDNAPFPAGFLTGYSAGPSSAESEPSTWELGGHLYRGLVTAVAREGAQTPASVIAIAINIDHHREFMSAFYRSLSLAIATGVVLTALLGWFAARRGLAPLRAMAGVARSVTASRLEDRLVLDRLPVELVDLASAFNAMLSRLEDSFRRLSEFSSDLAHELRTPISNLMTQTQVALSHARSADEYREVLYSNTEEFDRLARMIADMLFLAKADNGLIVPRSEAVDLESEVRDLFDYYDALVEERGVRLAVSGSGKVIGERLMIRRAISNLLSNAVNHTARGGCVNVRLDAADGGAIRVTVENPGETIPAEHLPRLFERFYRVDPARQRLSEGAGLGLAITKSIVAAHHGTVRAFSTSGVTRIEMLFPVATTG